MTTRDPRSRAPSHPEVQGYGRDPTQSLSLDAALDEAELAGAPAAGASLPHPSIALGTHEGGGGARRDARTRLTQADSPGGRDRPAPPPVPRAPTASDDDRRIGSVLGSYKIVELLGRGGMGYVFRAEHVKLGRAVALKLLRGDYAARRDAVARFFQEARTVNRVRHRNIVDVTDFVELDDGTTFIIMEFLNGGSLGHWALAGVDLPRALAVLVQICDGLGAAHEVGVIHRDLKPDNVFIVPTPDGAELVKLLDFGVAKLVNRDDEDVGFQTAAGSVIGTPAYMSPEQAGGMAVDARSDIYSLGAIMYELFTGQPMFRGRSFGEYVRKHLTEMPVPPRATPGGAQIDPRLEALIMKCLEKDPIQRFRNIVELREALLAMLGGMETYLPGLASVGGSGIRAVGASVSVAPLPQLPGAAAAQQLPTYVPPSAAHAPLSSSYGPLAGSNPPLLPAYGSQSVPPTAIQRSTPWWVWFVGGAIAVGVGISAAVWYAGRPALPPATAPAAATAPTVSQPAPIAEPIAPPAATTVAVRLDSTPAGDVFADGATTPLCHTPCTYDIDPKDGGSPDQRRYVVRSDGYQDGAIVVDLKGAQRDFKVALEPRPEQAEAKPEARDEAKAMKPAGKPGLRTRTIKRAAKRPDEAAAKPDDKKPDEAAAKPDDKNPDNPDLIDPGPGRPTKKPDKRPPGSIDAADTLDPFHKK
jgi:serine/threonine protein kinase